MSCGACTGAGGPDQWARTSAAMCAACLRANWPHDRPGVLAVCTIDGGALAPARRTPCPLGRHADADGVVRWMGVRWYGVPLPVRAYLAARGWLSRPLSGCGCVKALKDWTMMRRRERGVLGGAGGAHESAAPPVRG